MSFLIAFMGSWRSVSELDPRTQFEVNADFIDEVSSRLLRSIKPPTVASVDEF